ncbi:MAG: hypothetical protein ACYC96_10870 [Fimbriimonadaceae bacterium]
MFAVAPSEWAKVLAPSLGALVTLIGVLYALKNANRAIDETRRGWQIQWRREIVRRQIDELSRVQRSLSRMKVLALEYAQVADMLTNHRSRLDAAGAEHFGDRAKALHALITEEIAELAGSSALIPSVVIFNKPIQTAVEELSKIIGRWQRMECKYSDVIGEFSRFEFSLRGAITGLVEEEAKASEPTSRPGRFSRLFHRRRK